MRSFATAVLLGRFLFGLGGESISVAQSALVERWFASRELAFALGASLSLARFGSVINNQLSPYIARASYSVAAPLWFGTALCALSLSLSVLLLYIDRSATRSIQQNEALVLAPSPPLTTRFHPSPPPSTQPSPLTSPIASPLASPAAPSLTGTGRSPLAPAPYAQRGVATQGRVPAGSPLGPSPLASSPLAVPPLSAAPPLAANTGGGGGASQRQCAVSIVEPIPPPKPPASKAPRAPPRGWLATLMASCAHGCSAIWADVHRLPRAFWLLSLLCVIVYGAVLPFNNVASALLLDRDYFPQGSVWWVPDHPTAGHASKGYSTGSVRIDGAGAVQVEGTHAYVFDGHPPPGVACLKPSGQATAFCQAQAQAQAKANLVMSEPYSIAALLTPLIGSVVDRCGGRAFLIILSAFALVVVHLLLALTALPAEVRSSPSHHHHP